MSKRNIIAVAVLLVLVVIFFLTRKGSIETIDAPYTIAAVEAPTGIEIVPGAEPVADGETKGEAGGEAARVRLEKRDGAWRMVEPYDVALDAQVASGLDEALDGGAIATDDLDLDEARARDYWLDPQSRTRVLITGAGGTKAEFYLGRAMTVEGTGARRSYVAPIEGNAIYRAHTDLAELLRRDVDALRSKEILDLKADGMRSVQVTPAAGQPFTLEKQTVAWTLTEPTPAGFALDEGEVQGLVNVLQNLRADHFRDDLDPTQIGLEPTPAYTITVTDAGGTAHTLELVERTSGEADAVEHLVRRKGSPFIMSVGAFQGSKLMRPLSGYRDRTPLEIKPEEIASIRLAGPGRARLVREGEGWKMTSPKEQAVEQARAEGLVSLLARLRVQGYPEVRPEAAGLERPSGRVTITTSQGGEINLFLGKEVEGGDGSRYAWVGGENVIFTLPAATVARLRESAEELSEKGS